MSACHAIHMLSCNIKTKLTLYKQRKPEMTCVSVFGCSTHVYKMPAMAGSQLIKFPT